jgi:hypothetical protein
MATPGKGSHDQQLRRRVGTNSVTILLIGFEARLCPHWALPRRGSLRSLRPLDKSLKIGIQLDLM